jgi:dTDP-4-amino-4,6-dideoxygalactose transaminase
MEKRKIWLSVPHMGSHELVFVNEAFETNWISPVGPHLGAFEESLASHTGTSYCAALSSGTAAIHLALIILGVKQDDEVICSTFTFSGSCNPVAYLGAKPVFVDSELSTWNMEPHLLEQAIQDRVTQTGRKPKAIIVVHLYGMPCRIDDIMDIARRFQIPVIEDAAEALGSRYKDKPLGGFGDFGILSFNGNKIITTSGGGALLSDNGDWIEKARYLATQARDPAPHYQHTAIGYNYRLSNVCAGIGRGQLMVLDERVNRRREIYAYYKKELQSLPGVDFPGEPEGSFSNRWLTTILIDPHQTGGITSEQVMKSLADENIESRPLWKPMHQQPVFQNCDKYLNGISDKLFANGLCLPSSSSLQPEDLDRVVKTIRRTFNSV